MAAPAGRALRQVVLLRRISFTPARGASGAGKGSPQHRASKTLVSFPVKFSAASQDLVTSEGRSDVLSKLAQPAASIALQELGDQGPGEHVPGKSLGREGKLHPGDEGSREKVKSVGKGPERDEDSSSSSSSDSEDEWDTGAQVKAVHEVPGVRENGFSSMLNKSDPSGYLLNQDGISSATVHPEIQPGEGISGDKTEPLIDHAPVIHAEGETQGEDSPRKTKVSAEFVLLTGSPGPEGAEIESSIPDAGPVVHSESQPGVESRRDDCEQLMDQAPVIHGEGVAQEKAPEKLGDPVGDVPLTEATGPEGVEMERSGEDTKTSEEASPAAQSPAPSAEVCETNPVGTEEENATKSSAPPPPPAAALVPPAVPVVEEAPFDNSKYQNLQHYSYTPYTFVDCDLALSKSRLPQPSAGRPSPRH